MFDLRDDVENLGVVLRMLKLNCRMCTQVRIRSKRGMDEEEEGPNRMMNESGGGAMGGTRREVW